MEEERLGLAILEAEHFAVTTDEELALIACVSSIRFILAPLRYIAFSEFSEPKQDVST